MVVLEPKVVRTGWIVEYRQTTSRHAVLFLHMEDQGLPPLHLHPPRASNNTTSGASRSLPPCFKRRTTNSRLLHRRRAILRTRSELSYPRHAKPSYDSCSSPSSYLQASFHRQAFSFLSFFFPSAGRGRRSTTGIRQQHTYERATGGGWTTRCISLVLCHNRVA